MRLPKLERLLLDCDINPELEPLLRAVGFRTEFVKNVGVNVRDDTEIIKWARRHRYILVCHDRHKDKRTQLQLFPELRRNGGKIIEIGGHTGQDLLTALGKILVHREEWMQFFKENDGIATVHRTEIRKKSAHELYKRVQGELALGGDPARTLKHRKHLEQPTRKRIKDMPAEQQQLEL